MSIRTETQNAVYNEAKRRMCDEPWYQGVCLDDFPDHQRCRDDFEGAVESVVATTMSWDAV